MINLAKDKITAYNIYIRIRKLINPVTGFVPNRRVESDPNTDTSSNVMVLRPIQIGTPPSPSETNLKVQHSNGANLWPSP